MTRWLLAPATAPVAGLIAGIAVFASVLVATPPGLVAPYWLFAIPVQNPVGESLAYGAAYATGAASALGLIALGLVAGLLWLVRAVALVPGRRAAGERRRTDGESSRVETGAAVLAEQARPPL